MAKANRTDVKGFVKDWSGRGDEKQDSSSFWTDFLVRCLGTIPETIPQLARFERPVKGKTPSGKTATRYVDVLIPDHRVLIEQKSLGIDLDRQRDDGIWGMETSMRIQQYLADHGHDVGPDGADGYFGPQSVKALQESLNEGGVWDA